MIKKLKLKFIALSLAALFILLTVIVAGMNLVNYRSVVAEADEILALLSHNKGTFPNFENAPMGNERPSGFEGGLESITEDDLESETEGETFFEFDSEAAPAPMGDRFNRLPTHMSPETPYESRYFSVLIASDGSVLQSDVRQIASINAADAEDYAKKAFSMGESGFIGQYRFIKQSEGDGVRVTFLDWGRKLDAVSSFLVTSCIISLVGFAIISIVICILSGRIIRPIAESYEKQKRFITDAGHEIKTPLTIINANVDILEMECGGNESLNDIRQQTKRLTTLTNRLVTLARMEETENDMPMADISVSQIVREISEAFVALAKSQGKRLFCNITEDLTLRANDIAIGQLTSILLENALKYSPNESDISLTLAKQGRGVALTVSNLSVYPLQADRLDRIFDRFYRADPSRNSTTGGHGIGLSVAKAIVIAHGGKITASCKDGKSFIITAIL